MKALTSYYRVRFFEKDPKNILEVVVKSVQPSEFIGLIQLRDFVFDDNKKHVVLPSEDEARKRFKDTKSLHIPYHNLLTLEEFVPVEPTISQFPFVKPVSKSEPNKLANAAEDDKAEPRSTFIKPPSDQA